jgi:hypothetical protein
MIHRSLILAVLFLVPLAPAPGQGNWTVPVTVSDGANSQILNFGVHPGATDGFDGGRDVSAPPAPPLGAFDARFRVLVPPNDFFTDVRSSAVVGPDTIRWTMLYSPQSPRPSLTVTWNPANLLGRVAAAFITDNVTGGLFVQSMLVTSSVSSTSTGLGAGLRIVITDPRMPVTLASFTARHVPQEGVRLDWVTLSEINNYGFEVQRRGAGVGEFARLPGGFVPGHGTTTEPHTYTFTDPAPSGGTWEYRLRQIDLDGTSAFSPVVQADVPTGVTEPGAVPQDVTLEQNYPNPFNPSTEIRFALPVASEVSLRVFSAAGEEVAVLAQGRRAAGIHTVTFRADDLPSGLYVCRMLAGGVASSIKLMLVR